MITFSGISFGICKVNSLKVFIIFLKRFLLVVQLKGNIYT